MAYRCMVVYTQTKAYMICFHADIDDDLLESGNMQGGYLQKKYALFIAYRHTYGEVSDAKEMKSKAITSEHTAGKEGDSGKLQCYV